MPRVRVPRALAATLIAMVLLTLWPILPPAHAQASCGSWAPTTVDNDKRITITAVSSFQGDTCEVAFQLTDQTGTVTLPLVITSIKSQIAGYTLELNVTGSDNAAVTALNGQTIPGIDADLHLKPQDIGKNAMVTIDASVTAKSLGVDLLVLMIGTILDALHIPGKCVPYSYVYGLALSYGTLGAKAGGELLAGHLANAYGELNAIRDDVFKNTLQKIIDGAASAGVGCLIDFGVDAAKGLLAHVATGGADIVLLGAKAVANAALVGSFITADWFTHQGKHTVVSLNYSPKQTTMPTARSMTLQGPSSVFIDTYGVDQAKGEVKHVVTVNPPPNAGSIRIYKTSREKAAAVRLSRRFNRQRHDLQTTVMRQIYAISSLCPTTEEMRPGCSHA